MIIEILLLLEIVALCVYSSVTDIHLNLIQNSALLFFFGTGAVLNTIYYVMCPSLFPAFIFNEVMMIIISVLLYAVHIWAAGDSKLLIVICFLIPARMTIYNEGYLFEFLIPVYAFALSFIYLIIETVVYLLRKDIHLQKERLKTQFQDYGIRFLRNSIYMVTLLKIEQFIVEQFGISLGMVQWVLNIFLLILIANLSFSSRNEVVFMTAAGSVVLSMLTGIWILSPARIVSYLIVAIFGLASIIINEFNYVEIPIDDLQQGMILSSMATLQFYGSKIEGLPGISTEDLRSRLTEGEVAAVKRWKASQGGRDTIYIVRKLPFAVFISIGTAVYFLFGVYLRCI